MINIYNKIKQIQLIQIDKGMKESHALFIKYLRHDSLFKKIVQYTYDPIKKYNIKVLPFKNSVNYNLSKEEKNNIIKRIFVLLDKFSEKNTNGFKKSKIELIELINKIPLGYDIFSLVLTKNLKIGINEKRLFDIWPNFINKMPRILYKQGYDIDKLTYPVYIMNDYKSLKVYIFCDNINKDVIYVSSNNIVYDINCDELDNAFLSNLNDDNQKMVYICDLLLLKNKHTDKYIKMNNLKIVNDPSILKNKYYSLEITKGAMVRNNHNDNFKEMQYVNFCINDIIPIKNFKKRKYNVPLNERLLSNEWVGFKSTKRIFQNDFQLIHKETDLFKKLSYNLRMHNIGIVIRKHNSIWDSTYNQGQIRLSEFYYCYFQIKDIKLKSNKLFYLLCESKCKKCQVKVSKGFSYYDIKHHSKFKIGTVIKIRYYRPMKIRNSNKTSLFNPRYICISNKKAQYYHNLLRKSKELMSIEGRRINWKKKIYQKKKKIYRQKKKANMSIIKKD